MSALKLYVNIAETNPTAALVVNEQNLLPVPLPEFVLGDVREVELYLADGEGDFSSISGSGSYTPRMAIGPRASLPSSGTYTLTDGTDTTTSLDYNASASAIQTALNALNTAAGPFSDTVTVEGSFPSYRVTFDSNGAQTNLSVGTNALSPESGITISEITAGDGSTQEVQGLHIARQPLSLQETFAQITDGWSGELSFATYEMRSHLGSSETATDLYLEVEVTDSSGNRRTYLQIPITVRNEVIDASALVPSSLASYQSETEARAAYIQNRSDITGRTGGTSSDLDSIATASGAAAVGWVVAIEVDADGVELWKLRNATTAEDAAAGYVRPDDYATTTNERVWERIAPIAANKSSAVVVGSGTDYTLTNSAARVDFGTTDIEASLPAAGTYLVTAILSIIEDAGGGGDDYDFKLYNSTAAADVTASQRSVTGPAASKVAQVFLQSVVTVTAASTIQVYGVNNTAGRGTVDSAESTISYIRL